MNENEMSRVQRACYRYGIKPTVSRYDVAYRAIMSIAWIPLCERVPDLNEDVLATTYWGNITIAERIGIDKYFIHEGSTNARGQDIVAWQPLPEPYVREGEEE